MPNDCRYAIRSLLARPSFAATVLTLAIGIGATTTIFGVVDAVLLRPLWFIGARLLRSEGLPRAAGLDQFVFLLTS